jgi:hypothetical protein
MQVWSELVFGSDVDSLQLNLSEPPPPPSPPAASPTRCQTGLIALTFLLSVSAVVIIINTIQPINYTCISLSFVSRLCLNRFCMDLNYLHIYVAVLTFTF